MKPGIILWNLEPMYPYPGSPKQRALKFSAVLGVVSSKSSNKILPAGCLLMATSIATIGLCVTSLIEGNRDVKGEIACLATADGCSTKPFIVAIPSSTFDQKKVLPTNPKNPSSSVCLCSAGCSSDE